MEINKLNEWIGNVRMEMTHRMSQIGEIYKQKERISNVKIEMTHRMSQLWGNL